MENTKEDIKRLERELKECQKLLNAIGDETRARIIVTMLKGKCDGERVKDIASSSYLSRAATSHHIKILKDASVVKSRKEGKNVYYYLDPSFDEITKLIELFKDIKAIAKNAPSRGSYD